MADFVVADAGAGGDDVEAVGRLVVFAGDEPVRVPFQREVVVEGRLVRVVQAVADPRDGFVAGAGDVVDAVAVLAPVFLVVDQAVLVGIAEHRAGVGAGDREDVVRVVFVFVLGVAVVQRAGGTGERIEAVFDFPAVRQAVAVAVVGAEIALGGTLLRRGPVALGGAPEDVALGAGEDPVAGLGVLQVMALPVAVLAVLRGLQVAGGAVEDVAVAAEAVADFADLPRIRAVHALVGGPGERRGGGPAQAVLGVGNVVPPFGQQRVQALLAEGDQAVVVRVRVPAGVRIGGFRLDRVEAGLREGDLEGVDQPVAIRVVAQRTRPLGAVEHVVREVEVGGLALGGAVVVLDDLVGLLQFLLVGEAVAVDVEVRVLVRDHLLAGLDFRVGAGFLVVFVADFVLGRLVGRDDDVEAHVGLDNLAGDQAVDAVGDGVRHQLVVVDVAVVAGAEAGVGLDGVVQAVAVRVLRVRVRVRQAGFVFVADAIAVLVEVERVGTGTEVDLAVLAHVGIHAFEAVHGRGAVRGAALELGLVGHAVAVQVAVGLPAFRPDGFGRRIGVPGLVVHMAGEDGVVVVGFVDLRRPAVDLREARGRQQQRCEREGEAQDEPIGRMNDGFVFHGDLFG